MGFIKKVMKQMQQPQYTPMKKMEVDMRPLDAEEEKATEGRDWLSILDLHSVVVMQQIFLAILNLFLRDGFVLGTRCSLELIQK